MAIDAKPGSQVKLTVARLVVRESARKTLERLFMTDPAIRKPYQARISNFVDKPKRRGGRIWTKHPNKPHLKLNAGDSATIHLTPQAVKDLASVKDYVSVSTI